MEPGFGHLFIIASSSHLLNIYFIIYYLLSSPYTIFSLHQSTPIPYPNDLTIFISLNMFCIVHSLL